jgi:hypothetical protein
MSTEQELQALFRAEQAASPAPHAINQGWSRLAVDLAANVAPMPVSGGALKLATWLIPKWLLLGFAVGLTGAGVGTTLLGAQAVPKQISTPPARLTVLSASTAQSMPTETSQSYPAPVSSAPSTEPRITHGLVPIAASSAPTSDTFDAELKLISLAKGELDAGRPSQARAWLEDHAQRFPNGVFAVEREALQIVAQCQQGPKDEALASAFAKRHPGSPLVARLQHACQSPADSNSLNGAGPSGEPMSRPSQGNAP